MSRDVLQKIEPMVMEQCIHAYMLQCDYIQIIVLILYCKLIFQYRYERKFQREIYLQFVNFINFNFNFNFNYKILKI